MLRRPPRSTLSSSSAASDVYKRQTQKCSPLLTNFIRVLKHWTGNRGLLGPASPSCLSSYSWTLLAIHTLQTRGLLPWVDVSNVTLEIGRTDASAISAAVAQLIDPEERQQKRARLDPSAAQPAPLCVASCFVELLKLILFETRYKDHVAISIRHDSGTSQALSKLPEPGAHALSLIHI
eukprot:TRINITY_DN34143_c0_g1_i1.p1 TRINITY_DN34143_c0_g1~~TRINITY_DN34143_c0_g1_i1.p1  ORF type:complete len:179 (-),score=44.57 TRINITY_DN34143_c0_g1_i1:89-625(-)